MIHHFVESSFADRSTFVAVRKIQSHAPVQVRLQHSVDRFRPANCQTCLDYGQQRILLMYVPICCGFPT
jgi:hypothetical protein